MSLFRTSVAGRLCLPALLFFSIPVFAQSESLGEVARHLRAERERSGVHPKVYTNEDFAGSSAGASRSTSAASGASGKDDSQNTAASSGNPSSAGPAAAKSANSADDAAAAHAAREEESQKRAEDTNQRYLDQIAGLRKQIATAREDLDRLQRDQIESTNHYRSSNGVSPSVYEYQSQQQLFAQQIEEKRQSIESLNTQLDDAYEAARHAGVPHAAD